MASVLAWLDTCEKDKRRALDVISLFQDKNTRDELGLGTVRDALADQFSPGTSTIQTRARYFLFIPWMYLRFERLRRASSEIAEGARNAELRLIDVLSQSNDTSGVIGIESRRKLQRLPSSIYWNGLREWGIHLFRGSQDQYHRSLDRFYRDCDAHGGAWIEGDDDSPPPTNWHPHVPAAPDGFPWEASLKLNAEETAYLEDRIRSRAPGSLLAFLVDHAPEPSESSFSWEHPLAASFPPELSCLVDHAKRFSGVMHGAALLYNLKLARQLPQQDLIHAYEASLGEWAEDVELNALLDGWDLQELWHLVEQQGARVPIPTRHFVGSWVTAIESASAARIRNHKSADDLITNRERSLKGPRARLTNRKYLELWSGEAGTARLDFRWGITQRLINDFVEAKTG